MKKIFKTLAVLAAVAALGFGCVSCGDSGDDNNGNSGNNNTNPAQTETALAVFTCDSGYDKRTLTFNDDSTFKVIVSDESEPQAAGTYTFDSGDWENGTITLTATSGYKQDTFTGTKTISEKKITFSTKTYTLTGGTLKTPSESNESGTKQDEESGDSGNGGQATTTVTATFTSTEFYGGTIKIEYKADGTYLMTWSGFTTTNKGKGTYTLTGTFENGTIHQHQTHSSDTLDGEWVAEVEDNNLLVTNGSFTVQLEENGVLKDVTFTKTTSSSTGGTSDAGAGNNNGNGGASTDTGSSDSTEETQLAFNSEELNNKVYEYYVKGNTNSTRHYVFTENKCYKESGYTADNAVCLAYNYMPATSDKVNITVTKKGNKYYVSDDEGENREITFEFNYHVPATPEECAVYVKKQGYIDNIDTTTRFDATTQIDGDTDLVVAYTDGTFEFAGISRESTLYLLTSDKKYMVCFVKRSALRSSLFDFQNDGYIMLGDYRLSNSTSSIHSPYSTTADLSETVYVSVILDKGPHSLGPLPVKFLPGILKGYKIYSDDACTQEITDWAAVPHRTLEKSASIYAKLDS